MPRAVQHDHEALLCVVCSFWGGHLTMHGDPLLIAIFEGPCLGLRSQIPVYIFHMDSKDTVTTLHSIVVVSKDDQGLAAVLTAVAWVRVCRVS